LGLTEHPREPQQPSVPEGNVLRGEEAGKQRAAGDASTGPVDDSAFPWSAPFTPPAAGAQIGGYRITEVIGAGGMGTVYLAQQDHPRRVVALKVMRPGVGSKDQLRRFQQEAEILGRMRHPAIAQVYEAGTHHDIPYFAMEYIPGAKPITAYAATYNLTVRQRLELFARVCEAVQHGHNKGIIHRDLKPANVLVDSTGNPKVIDFGVARATDCDVAVTAVQTGLGQLVGTLAYMSPEQLRGDPADIDLRSDVYALGVVLYELLCGRLPHDVRTAPMLEAARIIREDPPTRPSIASNTVRGDLETIILKALEKDRERRYVSAEELRRDLLRYLAGQPIIARPPTVTYLVRTATRRFTQRHPVVAALFVAAFVALLGAPAGYVMIYHVPTLNDAYARVLAATMPGPSAIPRFEHVRIIRITDATAARMTELAEMHSFDDVTPETWRSIRRLHGALMERLVEAKPAAVAWDFRFAQATEYDADFLRGAEALANAGISVVVVTEWLYDAELTDDDISPAILAQRHILRGPAAAHLHDLGVDVELLSRPGPVGAEPIASMALAAFAAAHHPGTVPRVALDERRMIARVSCYSTPDESLSHIQRLDGHFHVKLSGTITGKAHPDLGPDETVGLYSIIVPTDEALSRAAADYDRVFDMEPEEMESFFRGKIVVVGDYRGGFDCNDHRGRVICGADINATALEAMMRGDRWLVRWERPEASAAAIAFAALLGVSLAGGAAARHSRRARRLVLAAAIMLLACMLAYPLFRLVINPIVPIAALALASELGAAALRLRASGPS
jgi:hypothetical protein